MEDGCAEKSLVFGNYWPPCCPVCFLQSPDDRDPCLDIGLCSESTSWQHAPLFRSQTYAESGSHPGASNALLLLLSSVDLGEGQCLSTCSPQSSETFPGHGRVFCRLPPRETSHLIFLLLCLPSTYAKNREGLMYPRLASNSPLKLRTTFYA